MKQLINLLCVSLFLVEISSAKIQEHILTANNDDLAIETSTDLNNWFIELSDDNKPSGILNKTYLGSCDTPSGTNDSEKDNIPLKIKSSQIKVNPSCGNVQGGCNSNGNYVEISGACFGNGWDINSVTICGVEVCHIIMQSSNLVAVYPDSGTPGTGDIVITSESMGQTVIENGFTYKVSQPKEQAENILYSNIGNTWGDISWKRGDGEFCVVFMKQDTAGFSTPSDHIKYESGIVFGDGTQIDSTGWFCVYNGNGSSVSVSGLKPGAPYSIRVFEYNGPTGFETYLTAPTTGNPKIQEAIATKDKIKSEPFSRNNSAFINE
jgi:hypothetical protein